MPDTILDDVIALLLKEKGDKRILEQIKRAAENNEVISVYERNYVTKLKQEFLEKKPGTIPKQSLEPQAQTTGSPKPTPKKVIYTPPPPPPEPQKRKNPKQMKIIAGAGGAAALVAILVIGISMSGFNLGNPGSDPSTPASGILLSADEKSYSLGDIISISGKSDSSLGNQVILSIENSNNDLVWTENVNVKSDGGFSTLAIAGGTGWSNSGTYTLTLEHGEQTESIDFSFQG